ncbi:centromere protein F isoform X2 [Corythoichthys intestinalis]|uniref:centromere protein F isoform X2 n=1 Tax=Corythoichthys intestinalis TaxID=161448 RepID=UPI0025A55DA2|nr:centromere protein F isoform X2 [Corythoichthys intestinalis]
MNWAEEDWMVGLSGRVLQKVKELQAHQDRLCRENKQKQLQLDNIHISHDKQSLKYEEVRGELQAVRKELQSVREEAHLAVNGKQRLTQELQTKQAQVCSLEGQLDAARTLSNKLSLEVKRLEAELEKLQNGSRSVDNTPFSTPSWSPTSSWKHNGSRKDERTLQREESHSSPHIQKLRFSDSSADSSPRQPKTPPRSNPSDQSDSLFTTLAVFPWERDDPKPAARRASPSSPQTPAVDIQSKREVPEREKELCTQADTTLSQMRCQMASLKDELSLKATTLKSLQDEVAQGKKKMAATEISLQRAHNELSVAHTRISQESERASGAEHKLKQLQEELKCQRQNAESSRLQHQQRTKELDKQHQRDLKELQKEKQCMEKQHQQEVNKLNQELQQARTLHNAMQAQADKLSQQKQALEKELESLKEKVKFTEGQLQESQKNETQLQAKLKEVMLDAEGVALSLEQSKKRTRVLEEEASRLVQEQADTLRLLKEIQELKTASSTELVPTQPIGQSFGSQPTSHQAQPSTYTKSPPTCRAEPKGLSQEEESLQRAEISISYPPDREPGEGIDSEHITSDTEGSHLGKNYVEKDSYASENSPAELENGIIIPKSDKTICIDELHKENAALRSELRDVREELHKRLDDLEIQRRSEAEARTRLKQLSRKHANQGTEKEEQDKQWKAQLEREKTENDRLRKNLKDLEGREDQDGIKQAQEDREMEMMQLNMQLKKQLGEVKVQLALEQEGREREKEELTKITVAEKEGKKELSVQLEELRAQFAELKSDRAQESLAEEKLVTNGPLTYMTLHSDQLNSNISDNVLFCQSTNQHKTLGSLHLSHEGQMVSDLSDTTSTECMSSKLIEEIEHLRRENAQETERADQLQIKLTALQNQLTSQTTQLTAGFEKQSKYISGLLAELQEKDGVLLSQGEELRRCLQALDMLKDENGKRNTCKVQNEDQTEDCLDSMGCPEPRSNFSSQKDLIQQKHFDQTNQKSLTVVPGVTLQHENQFLKQSLETYSLSDTCKVMPKQLSTETDLLHDITAEKGGTDDDIIRHLQTQVVALQREREELTKVAQQQAEELSVWRLASQSTSTLNQVLPDQGQQSETQAQPNTEDHYAALVIREDEVLLSCTSNRLQGHMLSTSVQQINLSETSVHHRKPSDEESQLSEMCSSLAKAYDHQTGQEHISSRKATQHLSQRADSSAPSVSTQTEDQSCPAGTEAAPNRCCAHTQTDTKVEEDELDNSSAHGEKAAPSAVRETGDKMIFSTSFPIPADPVRLAERIRRNRTQLSAAFDDTEYEPYGLPEVVMKGFADIPTGPSCPYIVRRGLLGTAVVPVIQKEANPEDETD